MNKSQTERAIEVAVNQFIGSLSAISGGNKLSFDMTIRGFSLVKIAEIVEGNELLELCVSRHEGVSGDKTNHYSIIDFGNGNCISLDTLNESNNG
jgi:hypothetical protein